MKDDAFIEQVLQKGKEAKEKVSASFPGMSFEQINWKPSAKSWSIGQCLDHLINADSSYFPTFNEIVDGNYKISFWEKYSPFTKVSGNFFKDHLQEQVKRKMKAPKVFKPAASNITTGIFDRYYKNLESLLGYIAKCRNVDLDKTIITSPALSIVTYNLRDVFHFLLQHEHRHINQAIRVKMSEGFPTQS